MGIAHPLRDFGHIQIRLRQKLPSKIDPGPSNEFSVMGAAIVEPPSQRPLRHVESAGDVIYIGRAVDVGPDERFDSWDQSPRCCTKSVACNVTQRDHPGGLEWARRSCRRPIEHHGQLWLIEPNVASKEILKVGSILWFRKIEGH